MKRSDLFLFTATLALLACSKSDAARDAAVALPASTQDSAATAAAVAPVSVPAAIPAASPAKGPASAAGASAKSKPVPVIAPSAKPASSTAVAPVAAAPQPTPASAPPVVAQVAVASAPAENSVDGKTVYTDNCQKCHGATGTPAKAMKAKFDKLSVFDAAFFANRSVDSVVAVLIKGKGTGMKSFEGKLSAGEMRAVASYIRSFGK